MTQLMNQTLHVRFDGRSEEVTMATLNLASNATDAQIKRALASHFDLPTFHLSNHVVIRNSRSIIVRPEAIYG